MTQEGNNNAFTSPSRPPCVSPWGKTSGTAPSYNNVVSPSDEGASPPSIQAAGMSELSKQLLLLKSANHTQACDIDRLKRQLKLVSDLKGVSVVEMKGALADACKSEAYSELLSQVSSLQAQLVHTKEGLTLSVSKKIKLENEALKTNVAALNLKVAELEEVEHSLRKDLLILSEQRDQQMVKTSQLQSRLDQEIEQSKGLNAELSESMNREKGCQIELERVTEQAKQEREKLSSMTDDQKLRIDLLERSIAESLEREKGFKSRLEAKHLEVDRRTQLFDQQMFKLSQLESKTDAYVVQIQGLEWKLAESIEKEKGYQSREEAARIELNQSTRRADQQTAKTMHLGEVEQSLRKDLLILSEQRDQQMVKTSQLQSRLDQEIEQSKGLNAELSESMNREKGCQIELERVTEQAKQEREKLSSMTDDQKLRIDLLERSIAESLEREKGFKSRLEAKHLEVDRRTQLFDQQMFKLSQLESKTDAYVVQIQGLEWKLAESIEKEKGYQSREEAARIELNQSTRRADEQTAKTTHLESVNHKQRAQLEELRAFLQMSFDREKGCQAREEEIRIKLVLANQRVEEHATKAVADTDKHELKIAGLEKLISLPVEREKELQAREVVAQAKIVQAKEHANQYFAKVADLTAMIKKQTMRIERLEMSLAESFEREKVYLAEKRAACLGLAGACQLTDQRADEVKKLESFTKLQASDIAELKVLLEMSVERENGYCAREEATKLEIERVAKLHAECQLMLQLEQEQVTRLEKQVASGKKENQSARPQKKFLSQFKKTSRIQQLTLAQNDKVDAVSENNLKTNERIEDRGVKIATTATFADIMKLGKKVREVDQEMELDRKKCLLEIETDEQATLFQLEEVENNIRTDVQTLARKWDADCAKKEKAMLQSLPAEFETTRQGEAILLIQTEIESLRAKLAEADQQTQAKEDQACEKIKQKVRARERDAKRRNQQFKLQLQLQSDRLGDFERQLSTLYDAFGYYVV